MTPLLVALGGLPAVAGLALASAGRRLPGRTVVTAGLLVAAGTLALAVAAAAVRPAGAVPFAGRLVLGAGVDGLSAVMVVTVAAVTLLVLTAAAGEPDLRRGRFVGGVLVFAAAMLATVTATTLPALLGAWEVMGATSWVLIAHHRRERAAARAATTAFLTPRAADVGLWVAAGAALAGGVGTLALADLPRAAPGWLTLAALGVVLAAAGKSAQLPFSSWLSGAMAGPAPVSALLHSATMAAAGAYLLVRLAPLVTAAGLGPLVAWLGAATAVVLGLVAVTARDLKQLLAASTCAQVGLMLVGAGSGGTVAATGLLVAHAAVKALLFLAAGAWLAALGTRSLSALRGAARRHPVVGVTATVGALALAGIPPLSMWWAEGAALATVAPGDGALLVVAQVGAVLGAVYATRVLWFVWRPTRGVIMGRPVPRATATVLVVLAVPAAGLGAAAVGLGLVPGAGPGALVASGILAVLAAVATWVLHARPVRIRGTGPGRVAAVARGWWRLDAATRVVVVRPVLALAAALDRADAGIDRAVRGVAAGTVGLAHGLDRRGEGGLTAAVDGIGTGSRRLGDVARRLQSGQLHRYYATSAAALGVLGALAVVLAVTSGGR